MNTFAIGQFLGDEARVRIIDVGDFGGGFRGGRGRR